MSISSEWNKDVLYAHPGEPLEQHLLAVAHRTRELIRQAGAAPFREQLAFITGLCHDLAKATEDFQDYLYCSSHGQKWTGDADLKSHGRLGTLFCLTFGEKLVEATAGDKLAMTLEVWLAALAIRSHHGRLRDFTPEAFVLPEDPDFEEDENFTLISRQLQRLRRPHFDRLVLHPDVLALLTPQQVIDTIASRERWSHWRIFKRRKLDPHLRDKCGMEAWAFLKLIYGCLLQADKEQNLPQRLARAFFPTLEIARYAQSLSAERPIERIRRDLFVTSTRYAETVDLSAIHFHQLTLPTGAGKTLAGLQVAAIIRHRLEAHGKQPRIVYALPFLSIIDQNFKVFQKVFGENTGDLLLAHHHLADLDFKYYDEQLDPVSAAFKIDGWESELIVTTFHQLFATLFDTSNSANRRFAALQNAIVILDEPQALPPAYMRLIRGALKAMAQALEWQVIVMTATPPLLFDPADASCLQIVPMFRDVFPLFNRYQLFDERKRIQSIPALVDAVENEWLQGSRRILVVANTVNAAKAIYESLKAFTEKYGVERLCLTTEILPLHRLEKIKNIGGEAPVIVVSTQLIEAGVDISLDVVFRDFAPLPSLIQSAGRCRRHEWQECRGRVVLTHLGADENKPHANRIYDPVLLQMTESILQVGEEKSLWPVIQAFYERMQEAISQDEALNMLDDLRQLELKSVSMNFDLIPEKGKRRDLLILYDEAAHQSYAQWKELGWKVHREKNLEEVFRLLALRQKIWRRLAQYLIHPFEHRLPEHLLEDEKDLIVIEDDVETIYSDEIGLIEDETNKSPALGSAFF